MNLLVNTFFTIWGSKVPQIEETKCLTGKRFIHKEVTSYKIHILVFTLFIKKDLLVI